MMKNVIRKILFEESEDMIDKYDDELTSPEISISPDTELNIAEKKYSWESYIPEIGKKFIFEFNPEHWNLSANVKVEDVDKSGHGSFGNGWSNHPNVFKKEYLVNDYKGRRKI